MRIIGVLPYRRQGIMRHVDTIVRPRHYLLRAVMIVHVHRLLRRYLNVLLRGAVEIVAVMTVEEDVLHVVVVLGTLLDVARRGGVGGQGLQLEGVLLTLGGLLQHVVARALYLELLLQLLQLLRGYNLVLIIHQQLRGKLEVVEPALRHLSLGLFGRNQREIATSV